MIGNNIYSLFSWDKRPIYKYCGILDIHRRQKWNIVWPNIQKLSKNKPILFLDAGCGKGMWILEIAKRRPNWNFVGIDINNKDIHTAKENAVKLKLSNCIFFRKDFLDFEPEKPFDIIINVASSHYLIEKGKGEDLFKRYYSWLNNKGTLISFLPRIKTSNTALNKLTREEAISKEQLINYCKEAGLREVEIHPCIDEMAIKAKYMSINSKNNIIRALYFPIQLYLSSPKHLIAKEQHTSYAWLQTGKR